jgi:hypothetical protein
MKDRQSLSEMLGTIKNDSIICINDEIHNNEDDFIFLRDGVNEYLNSLLPEISLYEKFN